MTLVVAHRGNSAFAPENTLAAFRSALNVGVDSVELDVRLTKDGVVVLFHDNTIERTSTGTGTIRDWTYDELLKFDAGKWFSEEFAGEPIAKLSDVLSLVKDKAMAVVEIKEADIEQEVFDVIRSTGMEEQVVMISFNKDVLKRFHEIAPAIPTGYLSYSRDEGVMGAIRSTLDSHCQILDIVHTLVNPELVCEAKKRGIALWAWTADEPGDIQRLLELGVDGITTNQPQRVKDIIARTSGGKK